MLKRAAASPMLSATCSGEENVSIMQDTFHSLMLSITSLPLHLPSHTAERELDKVIIRKFIRMEKLNAQA